MMSVPLRISVRGQPNTSTAKSQYIALSLCRKTDFNTDVLDPVRCCTDQAIDCRSRIRLPYWHRQLPSLASRYVLRMIGCSQDCYVSARAILRWVFQPRWLPLVAAARRSMHEWHGQNLPLVLWQGSWTLSAATRDIEQALPLMSGTRLSPVLDETDEFVLPVESPRSGYIYLYVFFHGTTKHL